MHRTRLRTAALVLVGGALAGCSSGDGAAVVGASLASSASSTSAPATTGPTLGTTTTTTVTVATTSSTAARPTTSTTSARPKLVATTHGQRVVAVFLATAATPDDPAFATAKARLRALGYRSFGPSDTDCSSGAKAALPQLLGYSMAAEFATRAHADRFAALYGTVIGTATVTAYCLD